MAGCKSSFQLGPSWHSFIHAAVPSYALGPGEMAAMKRALPS